MSAATPVFVVGPTASGKSALAISLAQELGGTIINADSMQVYREAPILTAQPSEADKARAPHLLYGHVSAREVYSVGSWRADAADAPRVTSRAARDVGDIERKSRAGDGRKGDVEVDVEGAALENKDLH